MSRETMTAGKKTIFFILYILEQEPCVESFVGNKVYYNAIFAVFILLNSISQCQKNTFPGQHCMRNTKHIYNRRFLESCSVKSHRGCNWAALSCNCQRLFSPPPPPAPRKNGYRKNDYIVGYPDFTEPHFPHSHFPHIIIVVGIFLKVGSWSFDVS